MAKRQSPDTPILDARIADGSIVVVDGEYVGRARDEDGRITPVYIGHDQAPHLAERYLTDYPTADMW